MAQTLFEPCHQAQRMLVSKPARGAECRATQYPEPQEGYNQVPGCGTTVACMLSSGSGRSTAAAIWLLLWPGGGAAFIALLVLLATESLDISADTVVKLLKLLVKIVALSLMMVVICQRWWNTQNCFSARAAVYCADS